MKLRGETDRPPRKPRVPKTTTSGVLVRALDLGTNDTPYTDKSGAVKRQHKMALIFELPKYQTEFKDPATQENKVGPVHLWLYVSLTMGTEKKPSNLRDVWKALMGTSPSASQEVDLSAMLGKPCLITVDHRVTNDMHYNPETRQNEPDIYESIGNISPLPEEMPQPKATTPLEWYEIRDESGSRQNPPVWCTSPGLIESIHKSDEWRMAPASAMAAPPRRDLPVPKAGDEFKTPGLDGDTPF